MKAPGDSSRTECALCHLPLQASPEPPEQSCPPVLCQLFIRPPLCGSLSACDCWPRTLLPTCCRRTRCRPNGAPRPPRPATPWGSDQPWPPVATLGSAGTRWHPPALVGSQLSKRPRGLEMIVQETKHWTRGPRAGGPPHRESAGQGQGNAAPVTAGSPGVLPFQGCGRGPPPGEI